MQVLCLDKGLSHFFSFLFQLQRHSFLNQTSHFDGQGLPCRTRHCLRPSSSASARRCDSTSMTRPMLANGNCHPCRRKSRAAERECCLTTHHNSNLSIWLVHDPIVASEKLRGSPTPTRHPLAWSRRSSSPSLPATLTVTGMGHSGGGAVSGLTLSPPSGPGTP